MKIYLTGQSNFGNRGCEALVRSTVDVVRERYPDAQFMVPTLDRARDSAQWPGAAALGVQFVDAPAVPARFIHWSRVCSRLPVLTHLPWPRLAGSEAVVNDLRACDVLLSIGGDNYSLDYDLASLALFVAIADAAVALGKPAVLWGASVGPFSRMPGVERHMVRHLQSLQAITVRESHSQRYLAQIGITRQVTPVADSAFCLQRQAVDVAGFWPAGPGRVLGLNISPLVDKVRRQAGAPGDLLADTAAFIRQVCQGGGVKVLLVPHVAPLDAAAPAGNSDEAYLARLLQAVGPGVACTQVPSGLNACQLKDVIARCDFFIGARTHATIAALSSGVPTLSIAYSVKARGINLDLFGHEDLVLDTRQVSTASLQAGFDRLVAGDASYRAVLHEQVPRWRQRVRDGLVAASAAWPAQPRRH